MAHLIDSFAYTGQPAWHGLGASLPAGQSIEQWIQAAGMDWSIKGSPAKATTDDGTTIQVPDRQVLYRSDTNKALSVVSNRYKVVQPREILEFFRDLVEANAMQIETAGVLKGGRTLWALAKNDANAFSLGHDKVKAYTILSTACDGSMATKAYATSIRVVCNNTLRFSLSDSKDGVTVKHSTNFDANAVKQELGIDVGQFETFADTADNLAHKGIDDKTAVNYFAELYVVRDAKGNVTNEKTLERVVNDLMQSYKSGPGADLPAARGTAWGALNAVTHYVDHKTRAHNTENRFYSSQFGQGNNKKTEALEFIQADTLPFSPIQQREPVLIGAESAEPTRDPDFSRFLNKTFS